MGGEEIQEKWVIEMKAGEFLFSREVNGIVDESYVPVNRAKAAVFAAAVIQGFEPPRVITLADRGFQSQQDPLSREGLAPTEVDSDE